MRGGGKVNLYQINEQIEMLAEQMIIDSETGEIDEEVMAQLEQLNIDFDEKMENIGIIIKSTTAEVDALVNEKKALEKRIKVKMNKINRLCDYVNSVLKGKKREYGRVVYGFRRGTKVNVVNEDLVPDALCKYETTRKPMKTEIKALLKDGKDVPGCLLEETMNLQVL